MSGHRAVRLRIRGRVQGVWFRESTRRLAERRGVAGWVRNTPDGRVEAAFEGPLGAVEAMVDFAHVGPPDARVDGVEVIEEPPQGVRGFEVS